MENICIFAIYLVITFNFISGNVSHNRDNVGISSNVSFDTKNLFDGVNTRHGQQDGRRQVSEQLVSNGVPLNGIDERTSEGYRSADDVHHEVIIRQEEEWKEMLSDDTLESINCNDKVEETAKLGLDEGKRFTLSTLTDFNKNPSKETIVKLSFKDEESSKNVNRSKSSCIPRNMRKLFADGAAPTSEILKKSKSTEKNLDRDASRRDFFSRFPVSGVTESVEKYLSRFTHAPLTTPGPKREAYTSQNNLPPTDPYPHGTKPSPRFSTNCTDCDIFQVQMSKLELQPPPLGRGYKSSLDNSTTLFYGYVHMVLNCIQPSEIPVHLIKSYMNGSISGTTFSLKVIEGEGGVISILVLGIILSLCPTVTCLARLCLSPEPPKYKTWAQHCKKTTIYISLDALLILLLLALSGVLVTNDQASEGFRGATPGARAALQDTLTFIENTRAQINYILTDSSQQLLKTFSQDLDNIENLLGRPIQAEIVKETGINVALDSLLEMAAGVRGVCAQTENLIKEAAEIELLANSTTERLAELKTQVETTVRHCLPQDRQLCDTITTHALQIRFSPSPIITSSFLSQLRVAMADNLTGAAMEATAIFTGLPQKIEKESRTSRQSVLRQLAEDKSALREASKQFDDFSYRTRDKLEQKLGKFIPRIVDYTPWDDTRWYIGLGTGLFVLFAWLLMLFTLCWGCCAAYKPSVITIVMMLVCVCIMSLLLWSVAVIFFLVGGHGHSLACRALHQTPQYSALSDILDKPSMVSEFLYDSPSNLLIGQVLENCKMDAPTYSTFELSRVFNVSTKSNLTNWKGLRDKLAYLNVDLRDLHVLTPELHVRLNNLMDDLTINLTNFRVMLGGPVLSVDMGGFADHLENVASQMNDLNIASHLETLASRGRRLVLSHIQPLQNQKENLVYHLTALELKIGPLVRQVNQSISHLRTIQYFITSKGNNIAQQFVESYSASLFGYIEQYIDFLHGSISGNTATCRPFYNIYDYTRNYFCMKIVDPLNGFWFTTLWCLMIFVCITPLSLKLVDILRNEQGHTIRTQSEESINRDETPVWSTTACRPLMTYRIP